MLVFAVAFAAGCAGARTDATSPPTDSPYVLVLGTAQDGGLPQIGCRQDCCEAVRADPRRRRLVTSLLIADPRTGSRWLVDATPDIREQVELARGHPATRRDRGPRPPLSEGVFLTHGHMGHYTGLLHLGMEAYGARAVPVLGSARMTELLTRHEPWALATRQGHIAPQTLVPGERFVLHTDPATGEADLTITPLPVPHRDEITDTFAFVVRGPSASLLYVPDIDKWARWETPLEEALAAVDVALLDGAFFADGEIPGRSMAEIPHPFISETMARLVDAPAEIRARVRFTHLNHTNPAAHEGSAAARAVRDAGMFVAREGDIHRL